MDKLVAVGILLASLSSILANAEDQPGKYLGRLVTVSNKVSGDVYALSDHKLRIVNFNFNGAAPGTYFYVGEIGKTGPEPESQGTQIQDEKGGPKELGLYVNKTIELMLPDNLRISKLQWLSVWGSKKGTDFGHVIIPNGFTPPAEPTEVAGTSKPEAETEQYVGALVTVVHGVSGEVYAINNNKLRIDNFNFDGIAPAAFFTVGDRGRTGPEPDNRGTKIPDEIGSLVRLGRYVNQTIELTLPPRLTLSHIQWLSVWCYKNKISFGHVIMPHGIGPTAPPLVRQKFLGPLISEKYKGVSGLVTIENPYTIRVDNFKFDTKLYPTAYFIVGTGSKIHCCSGVHPLLHDGRVLKVSKSKGDSFRLSVPPGTAITEYDWISVYSFPPGFHDVGHVFIT